jgi:cystathionine beta-lyase
MRDDTKAVHAGLHPERFQGAVNPPVYHVSTVLSGSMREWEQKKKDWAVETPGLYYGRHGTPTTQALEEAVCALEGGHRSIVYPSGLAACAGALLSCLSAGDHVLMSDSVYAPTRNFARRVLGRFGVETTFFDPLCGARIEALMRPTTRAVYLESPGSVTFEVQDVPAIADVAHRRGALVLADNTWGTPLYFKPFEHGVDLSVQSATKYIVGHADAMMGVVTATKETWPKLKATTHDLGQTAGPDDVYFAQRGLRTLAVRLKQHWQTGLELAEWFLAQPEVETVLHPGHQTHPGHALWKRDFKGACGLFGVVMKPLPEAALHAFIDSLELFGLGASWGGFESLVAPYHPQEIRTATKWRYPGTLIRIHAGLENVDDLRADLEGAIRQLRAKA